MAFKNGQRIALVILDGWGYRDPAPDNAVSEAETPHFDRLWERWPHCLLRTDGADVGLPPGQFGNSEVGHLNIGAGRVVKQELPRIDEAIESGALAANETLTQFVDRLSDQSGAAHLWGLLSPGGVHSHSRHILALAKILSDAGLTTHVHAVLDGRDTGPRSARDFVRTFEQEIADDERIAIATVTGRYFAMDRDKRWGRTEKAYRAITAGDGEPHNSADDAIGKAYEKTSDEFVEPCVIGNYEGVAPGDGVLFANFRSDRVRQLAKALIAPDFSGFDRADGPPFRIAAGMVDYGAGLAEQAPPLFAPNRPAEGLGEVLAAAGRTQLRLAETEKYPHVTFFFNGGREDPFDGEMRILIPSPKVATYDLKPEMSAAGVGSALVEALNDETIDAIICNFANPDMVGHTGDLQAAIRAVETVDDWLGQAADTAERQGVAMLVTADHGNCEMMRDPDNGGPHTAHTTNPVPCILVNGDGEILNDGRLADIAPTLLRLAGIAMPEAMTGAVLTVADGGGA